MVAPNVLVEAEFNAFLEGLLAFYDGLIREQFSPLFGLVIAGAISGALHDSDNERGIWVFSEAHPEPWVAYGDGNLRCSPISRDQAELAILTAREQLVEAQALGRTRREYTGRSPARAGHTGSGGIPGVVHFGFDSSILDGSNSSALENVVAYLIANPEQVIDIVGHTCPLGDDTYNFGLAMRRAEAVAARLMQRGIEPIRIHVASAGERELIDRSISGYPANRRAELHFRSSGENPPNLVWAQQALSNRFGSPPYHTVERYIPREAPRRNDPQEDWHWGSLTSAMTGEIDHWIAHYLSAAKPGLLAAPQLNDRTIPVADVGPPVVPGAPPVNVRAVVLHPRPIVESIIDEAIAHPSDFVGNLVGEPAANRSTTPRPPAEPCSPP
jgi:outer membrane protein OmpA-like peptidoglycan-associated protein